MTPTPRATTSDDAGSKPDPWTCRYCGAHEVIPSLVVEHEQTCVARPVVAVVA